MKYHQKGKNYTNKLKNLYNAAQTLKSTAILIVMEYLPEQSYQAFWKDKAKDLKLKS